MNKTRRLVLIALFSAFLGIFSQLYLPVPSGIPLTLQTFAVALCGGVMGWSSGLASVFVWLLLGAAGLPLFSGFRGGVSVLFGPTGGFLIGFLLLVLLCGVVKEKSVWKRVLFGLIGLFLCHAVGVFWFCLVADQGIFTAVLTVSLPYVIKDVLCLLGANVCAGGILRTAPFLQKN